MHYAKGAALLECPSAPKDSTPQTKKLPHSSYKVRAPKGPEESYTGLAMYKSLIWYMNHKPC